MANYTDDELESALGSPPDTLAPPGVSDSDMEDALTASNTPPTLGTHISVSQGYDPELEARRVKVARELGTSPTLIGDVTKAEGEAELRSAPTPEGIAKASPGLAKALDNSITARMARGAVNDLTMIGRDLKSVGGDIAVAATRVNESVYRGVQLLGDVSGITPITEFGKKYAKKQEATAKYFAPDLTDAGVLERGVHSGIQSAATTLGVAGTAALAAPAEGAALLVAGVLGGISALDLYGTAREQKASVGKSLSYGAVGGLIETAFEVAPSGALLNIMTKNTGLGTAIKNFAVTEVLGEQASTHLGDLNTWATLNPDKTLRDYLEERPSAAAETLVATIIGGGVQVSAASAVNFAGEKLNQRTVERQRANDAVKAHETLSGIGAAVSENPLAARDKPTFKSVMESMGTDEGALKEVYVEASDFIEAVKASGMDYTELQKTLPGVFAQVDFADGTAGDIRISVADYTSNIVGTELDAELLGVIRTDLNGMSYDQAEVFLSQDAIGTPGPLSREEFEAGLADAGVTTPPQDQIRSRDRRGAAITPAVEKRAGDRRKDPATRQRISDLDTSKMTPDQLVAALEGLKRDALVSRLTGLGSRVAYEESAPSAVEASVDADSLKWINDNMSPTAGDALLETIGRALLDEGADAYHISGDEFIVKSDSEAAVSDIMARVGERLKGAVIGVQRPDGSVIEKRGVEVTYGVGKSKDEADVNLKKEKSAKESRGERAPRGERPPGVLGLPTGGEQDSVRPPAAKDEEVKRKEYAKYLATFKGKVNTASSGEVRKVIAQMLHDTGRFSKAVANTHAVPIAAFYETQAERIGMTALEYYNTFPLKITPKDSGGLNQGPRGKFNIDSLTISLLEGADLSTVIHESGHFFLEAMSDIAGRDGAPPISVEDFTTVLEWFGVKDKATWDAMTVEQKRPHHEQWAQSYERFTFEGQSPTTGMRKVFLKFTAWMSKTYGDMAAFLITNPQAGKLNDEVRAVMGRMLASSEAIRYTEEVQGYEPLFSSQKESGLTEAEYQDYIAQSAAQTDRSIDTMQRRSLRDMKWLSNAKNKEVKKLQKEADALRANIRAKVEAEVMAEPINIMRAELKSKDGAKLTAAWVRDNFSEDAVAKLSDITRVAKGVDPDSLADWYGYESSVSMVEAMLREDSATDKIDGLTDQRMLEEHGDLVDSRAVEAAALEAVQDEGRMRFMATGLSILVKSTGSSGALYTAAKQAADTRVSNTTVGNLHPKQYAVAQARASKKAISQVASDPAGAIVSQRNALLNAGLFRAATKADGGVAAGLKKIKRTYRAERTGNISAQFTEQLGALLSRFSIIPPDKQVVERAPLGDFITSESARLSAIIPDIPQWIINETTVKSYKDLTVDEFRELTDAVESLRVFASRADTMYKAIDDRTFGEEKVALLRDIAAGNPSEFNVDGTPKEKPLDFVGSTTSTDDLADKIAGEFLNVERIVKLLDGGKFGQATASLYGRVTNAIDTKAGLLSEAYAQIDTHIKKYSLAERAKFSRKVIGKIKGSKLTRESTVSIALLHGSQDGRDRLSNHGWSEAEQLEAIGLLDERDLDLVESIWGVFDKTLWPQLKALNERTRGRAPGKIPPASYKVGGRTMTGGYYRLKYIESNDTAADKLMDIETAVDAMLSGTPGKPRTSQNTSKSRVEGVKKRPRLDLGVMSEAINETAHDIALREAVADTARMMYDRDVKKAVIASGSETEYRAITEWLKTIALPPRNPDGFIENTLSIARKNTVTTLMSGLGTALQNVTGFASSLVEVPTGLLMREIARFYSPRGKAAYEFAIGNSGYLKNSLHVFDRDLQDSARRLTKDGNILPSTSVMLWFMTQVNKGIAIPTWNAAHAHGMKKFDNDHAKAVNYADGIVRQSQGSGRSMDAAKIMSGQGPGGQIKTIFTMFYSYFNAQLGTLISSGVLNKRLAKTDPGLAVALFTKDFLLVFAIPAILTRMVFSGNAPEDDDPLHKYGIAMLQYGLSMLPIVRDIGNYLLVKVDKELPNYGLKITPVESAGEGVVKGAMSIPDIISGEGTNKDTKDAIMGVSYAVGLPGKLIVNTTLGTKAILEGKAGPKALIYGPAPEYYRE